MKKLLALILGVAMAFTIGTGAMAYSDVEENTYVSEAVTVLSNLNILNGYEDGTFKPEATITRAEMAKIVCETLGYYSMGNDKTPFNDVEPKHWAAGYINTAAGLGIINGYGNGKFGPEDTVTYEQAVKMIVSALGYEPMAANKGGWPTGYTSVAANIGLTKGMSSSVRGDIAVLIYNALTTPVMEQTSYGLDARYEVLDGTGNKEYKTILTKRNIYIINGIVTESTRNNSVNITFTKDSKDGEFIKDQNGIFNIGDTNIIDYMHQDVEAYILDEDGEYTVLAVQAAKKTETFTIISDDIKNVIENKVTYYVDGLNSSKTKTLTVDKTANIEYNKGAAQKVLADFEGAKDIELMFVENDGDDSYDVVIATEYTSVLVDTVDTYKDRIGFSNGKSIVFNFDDKDKTYIFMDDEGNELTLADFEEDDVVAYVANSDNIKETASYIKIIKLSNSTIYGRVDSVNSSEKVISIDDEDYEVADDVWDKVSKAGTEGAFYIGITGKIVYFDGSGVTGKYGYIIRVGTNDDLNDETVVKMLTVNGIDKYTVRDNLTVTNAYENCLVEYKINSKGLISSIKKITNAIPLDETKYNADTEILKGKYIDKDTQVFVIDDTDDDESYVTDMNYFVDEGSYTGYMLVDEYNEVKVVVITDTNILYSNETGFAIVSSTSMTTIDDDIVFAVNYVQDEVEGTIYFEDFANYEDGKKVFGSGTVFVFNADADGFVRTGNYDIVATTDGCDFVPADNYDTPDRYGKDVEVKFGYILNNKRETNSKGELITIAEDQTYVITSETNKYTFDSARIKDRIEVEDFLSGNAYYDNNTPVMLKLVDGAVIDIYTISPLVD